MSHKKTNFEDTPVDPHWTKDLHKFSQRELDTALYNRARSGFNLHVQTLLENGANIQGFCSANSPALVAVEKGHYKTVKVILEQTQLTDLAPQQLLKASFENQHWPVMALLIEHGIDAKCFTDDPFCFTSMDASGLALTGAALQGDLKTVQKLITKNLVSKVSDRTIAAEYASSNGHIKTLEFLLRHKVNPEDLHMMTAETHKIIVEHTQNNRSELKAFEANKDIFETKSLELLRKKQGYIGNDLILAARTGRFIELLTAHCENNTLNLSDFTKTDRYGFTLVDLLAQSGELPAIFKAQYWLNNPKAAQQISTLVLDKNHNIDKQLEILISELNQLKLKKASDSKPLKLRSRTSKKPTP